MGDGGAECAVGWMPCFDAEVVREGPRRVSLNFSLLSEDTRKQPARLAGLEEQEQKARARGAGAD